MSRPRRVQFSGLLGAVVVAVLLATAAPAQAATAVAVWNMDDSGSTMADSSGKGHTGKLHNVAVRQPGRAGTAFGFLGRPSYVTVPSSSDFSPGTGNFQFTVNVRFSAAPSASVVDFDLLRRGLSGTAGGHYKSEILRSGKAFCEYRGSAGRVAVTGGSNLANNQWHSITCARVGNSVVLTVDGRSSSASGSIGTINNSVGIFIGAKDGKGGDQYTGLMDSVSIRKG